MSVEVHHIINDYNTDTGGAQRIVRSLHTHLPHNEVSSKLTGLLKATDKLPAADDLGLSSVYSIKAFIKIYRTIKRNVPPTALIHLHLFPTVLYVSLLKRLGFIKQQLYYTEHSTSNRRRNTWWGKWVDRLIYTTVDEIIAISEGVRDELSNWLPAINNKIHVIQNGSPLHFQSAIQHVGEFPLKVVSVGRLTQAKNYPNMIRSFAALDANQFVYQIAGDGELKNKLSELISAEELQQQVSLLGHVDDVYPLLRQADIYLIASEWEGFGLSAVEAMNASLPLVASDIPGLREVVGEESECALLVDPKQPQEITAALQKLGEDQEIRRTMGRQAFERSLHYSENRMVAAYTAIYKQVEQ